MTQGSSADPRVPVAIRNHLIFALPPAERGRLISQLSTNVLNRDVVLPIGGNSIERVYFPAEGFCSVATMFQSGRTVEVAMVGREGMLGLAATVEGSTVQAPTILHGESSTFYSIGADAFREEMDRRGAFCRLIARYAHAFTTVVMQSAACNAAHSVERRLARWLLQAHDRVERDEFPLTQDTVAMMLGASRPMVSMAAGKLQKAGLIRYQHGRMTIADRIGLESTSCECYATAKALLANVTRMPYGQLKMASVSTPRRRSMTEPRRAPYRCLLCGAALILTERDWAHSRLGVAIATESYRCGACDAVYVFTPSTGWWKSVAGA